VVSELRGKVSLHRLNLMDAAYGIQDILPIVARGPENFPDPQCAGANRTEHRGSGRGIRRVAGPSDAGEESFAGGVEADVAGIVSVLSSNAEADRMLADAAASLGERAAEISCTIAGIRTVGLEMQRIALNATIQAARLGQSGGALEIVANAVQGLAREAGAASAAVEDRLSALRDALSALDRSASLGGSAAQIPQLRGGAAGLKSMEEQARNGYSRTLQQIAQVKQQIGKTVCGLAATTRVWKDWRARRACFKPFPPIPTRPPRAPWRWRRHTPCSPNGTFTTPSSTRIRNTRNLHRLARSSRKRQGQRKSQGQRIVWSSSEEPP
jgi:hypothetical protein